MSPCSKREHSSNRETYVSRGIWRYGSQLPWRCAETFACFNQRCHGNVAIPPLDNSFCNYADDTPGGHFEMNTNVQTRSRRTDEGGARSSELAGCGQRLGERRRSEQLIQLTGDKSPPPYGIVPMIAEHVRSNGLVEILQLRSEYLRFFAVLDHFLYLIPKRENRSEEEVRVFDQIARFAFRFGLIKAFEESTGAITSVRHDSSHGVLQLAPLSTPILLVTSHAHNTDSR
ncbi:hypothetical protein CBL_09421 [Carabus blaptoides fortunei]